MRILRLSVLVAVLVPAVTFGVASTQAVAAAATCDGEPATIVGSPGASFLEGTPGRDVIVTNGSSSTYARGGDDLVCLTSGGYVDAGDGADDVQVTAEDAVRTTVCLGDGMDRFTGGPGADFVTRQPLFCGDEEGYENPDEGFPFPQEEARDVISTLAGNDTVQVGIGQQTADEVDMGLGNDDLLMQAYTTTATTSLDGGPGSDRLTLSVLGVEDYASDRWQLRNDRPTAGLATLNGARALRWSGLERFALRNAVALYTFRGSDGPEEVRSSFLDRARMGAGNDTISVDNNGQIQTRQVDLTGGPGADSVQVFGCGGAIGGSEGRDTVRVGRTGHCQTPEPFVLLGGPQADRLTATQRDRIDGGQGRDRCRGTTHKRMCEF